MLRPGQLLSDKYRILLPLGRGGVSGHTYLAEETATGNQCAIKVLEPEGCSKEQFQEIRRRFHDEAEYLRRLNGFNEQIPKFYEFVKATDQNPIEYIVQEFIEGQTLAEYMSVHGRPMSEPQVKDILSKLLPVISHIHDAEGCIHRDIKPGNIILRATDSVPVLIDYGIVKEYEITLVGSFPQTAKAIGTPGYYDEDQQNGTPKFTSDLYALGAVAVFLLTNAQPHRIRQRGGKLIWSDLVTGLSKDFFDVIDKAIEPSTSYTNQRYGSAEEMLQALNLVVSEKDLDEDVTRLRTRPSLTTATTRFRKCRECDWFVDSRDKNCPNCGAFNLQQYSEDEDYLFNHSAIEYISFVTKRFPRRTADVPTLLPMSAKQYHLISLSTARYIRQHTRFEDELPSYLILKESKPKPLKPIGMRFDEETEPEPRSMGVQSVPEKRPARVIIGEYFKTNKDKAEVFISTVWVLLGLAFGITIAVGILSETEISPCLSPCAVIPVAIGFISTIRIVKNAFNSATELLLLETLHHSARLKHLRNQLESNRKNLLESLSFKAKEIKGGLEKRYESESAKYRASQLYYKACERSLNERRDDVRETSTRFSELAHRLDKLIKEMPPEYSIENQKDLDRTSKALQDLSSQDSRYSARLLEIQLLRLNNSLHAVIGKGLLQKKDRTEAQESIDQISKLTERIRFDVIRMELGDEGSERVWVTRMTLIREAAHKLKSSMASYMADLVHTNREEEDCELPARIETSLNRLTTYLTKADFDEGYQMLEVKYGRQNRSRESSLPPAKTVFAPRYWIPKEQG